MATQQLEAWGMDWGTWIYDCPSGVSYIAAEDNITFGLSVEIDLGEALEQTLGFLPEDTRNGIINSVTSKVPEGRGTLQFIVGPIAGQTPCMSGTRHVFATVVLIASGTLEITLASGATVSMEIRIQETLYSQFEDCECSEEQVSLRETGTQPAMLASVVNYPASMASFVGPLHPEHPPTETGAIEGYARSSEQSRGILRSRANADVRLIEGIDDVLARNLEEDARISTVGELAELDPDSVDVHQISDERLQRFRAMAEHLITFPQLDEQDAELLTNGIGIQSVGELLEIAPTVHAEDLENAIAETTLPADYNVSRVKNLIQSIT